MKNNPFSPTSVVQPQLFAGRKKQILHVVRKMSQVREGMSSSFIISGERGIGKTALAKLLMSISQAKDEQMENLNFLTTYYTVEKNQSFRSVLQSSLNLLTDQLPASSIDRLKSHLGNFFKEGKFSLGAFGAKVEVEKSSQQPSEDDLHLKDQAVSILTNIIKGIKDDQSKKNPDNVFHGVFIVLDEMHNVQNIKGTGQIFRSIITTLDMNKCGNIVFLIISYPEDVKKMFKGDPSAKRNFDILPLEIMPDDEAQEILTKGFKQIDIKYDEKTLSDNISKSGGYPHSIQVLGHSLVEIDSDDCIDHEDWKQAIMKTAKQLQKKDFSNLYNFNGKITQREEVLNVLAMLQRPVSKTSLAKAFEKNIYVSSCLPKLKQIGAVKEELQTGVLSLQSYLFGSAIRMHIASRGSDDNKETLSDWYKVYQKLENSL